MTNFKPPETTTTPLTAEKALSLISKGWKEVRSSADADIQLIKRRANSFKTLADKELENFLNSASKSPFIVPTITASATTADIDFVKKLRPKLSEIRRAYSSPDFKWTPKGKLRIDLSAIKNAIVIEVEEEEDERFPKWRRVRFKEEGKFNWEPIKAFKSSSSVEIFEGIKNGEFVEKLKSSLKSICKEPDETKVTITGCKSRF